MRQTLFLNIVNEVAKETEIPADLIMSKKMVQEIVDARHIVVKLLYDLGFYKRQIAEKMNISVRAVHFILDSFDDRMKYSRIANIIYEKVKKKVKDMDILD